MADPGGTGGSGTVDASGAQAGQLDSVPNRAGGAQAGQLDCRSHLPQRPIWLCRICATDWPCLAARSLLPLDYLRDPAGLSIYLAAAYAEAMRDLYLLNPEPGPDPARMYARFVGWAKPRLDILRRRDPRLDVVSRREPPGSVR